MPHIILEGPVDIAALVAGHEPMTQQQAGTVLKLATAFVSHDGNQALVESLAAGGGPPQRFLTQIVRKDARTVIRIYPGSTPELTDGVRSLLSLMAARVCAMDERISVAATNLGRVQGP